MESNRRKLAWIGAGPNNGKRIALLIPHYNEGSRCHFESRLSYFDSIAKQHKHLIDVVLIDDGSTDSSQEKLLAYEKSKVPHYYMASVFPNANKVGALYEAVSFLHHDFIILSDFDTDIIGLEKLLITVDELNRDSKVMGCYFRMLPHEGSGKIFHLQQLEYSLLRCLYKYHVKEGSVPVMPGAGSCYKREVLLAIYNQHSGLRNGEDREATMVGLKLGYRTVYANDILTLTRPPMSFMSLVRQRIRWNLGYIQTFYKERRYYLDAIRKFNSVGRRTLLDAITINAIVLLPIFFFGALILNWKVAVVSLIIGYTGSILLILGALLLAPNEAIELRSRIVYLVLLFPIYKVALESIAWVYAFRKFIRFIAAQR